MGARQSLDPEGTAPVGQHVCEVPQDEVMVDLARMLGGDRRLGHA
jgi:hypothetical protein